MVLKIPGKKDGGSLFQHNKDFGEGISEQGIRPGQATLVVALDGAGDYDDIQSAIDNLPAGGGSIFIKEGVYEPYANINITSANISIRGAGVGTIIKPRSGVTTIINITSGGTYTQIQDLKIDGTNATNPAGIYADLVDGCRFHNLYITQTCGALCLDRTEYCYVTNCIIKDLSGVNANAIDVSNAKKNFVLNNVVGGTGTGGDIWLASTAPNENVIFGNTCLGTGTFCILVDNGENNIIACNVLSGQGSEAGLKFRSKANYNVVIGNSFGATNNVVFDDDTFTNIYANNTAGGWGVAPSDSGIGNIIRTNAEAFSINEIKNLRMVAATGVNLSRGHIVVFNNIAAGDEITTSTIQGDDLVFGMVSEKDGFGDGGSGSVQTEGKTIYLKVNGVIDIAIGDFIGCFTTVGIGMKAAAGDMAIAIALEAYTTNDSNGVIDALLISPRKI